MTDLLRRTPLHPQWLLGTRSEIVGLLRTIGSGLVLDIGCAGRWVERNLPRGCSYIGLDYSVTGKMYGSRPDVFADASQLPFADASFDVIVILEVIEHLRSPTKAFLELGRVLKPGGRLILSAPFLYPIHDAPYDFQRLTRYGLARDIEAAGLHVGEIRPSLNSAETAGVIACLALGGMALEAWKRRSPAMLLSPLLAAAVPLINLAAWSVGRAVPSWSAVALGYCVTASKP